MQAISLAADRPMASLEQLPLGLPHFGLLSCSDSGSCATAGRGAQVLAIIIAEWKRC